MRAVLGCAVSVVYFAFIGLLMLGNMLGDCFPDAGLACPTDHERNVRILSILFGGTSLYICVGALIGRYLPRSQRDRD